LFAPPNVKGWDGGLSWITTNTLLARYNEAATLLQGDVSPVAGAGLGRNQNQNQALERRLQSVRIGGVEAAKLFTAEERGDQESFLRALEKRLLQSRLGAKREKALRDYLETKGPLDDQRILNALRLVMCTPEYQLA
jgi:hypothetical protein